MKPLSRVPALPPAGNPANRGSADPGDGAAPSESLQYKGKSVQVGAQKKASPQRGAAGTVATALGRAPAVRPGSPYRAFEEAEYPSPQFDASSQEPAARNERAGARGRKYSVRAGAGPTRGSGDTAHRAVSGDAFSDREDVDDGVEDESDPAWRPRHVAQPENGARPQADLGSLAPLLQEWWESVRGRRSRAGGVVPSAALMSFSRWAIAHAPQLAPTTLEQCGELLDMCEGLAVQPGPDLGEEPNAQRALNLLLPLWLLHLGRPRTPAQQQRAAARLDVLRRSP